MSKLSLIAATCLVATISTPAAAVVTEECRSLLNTYSAFVVVEQVCGLRDNVTRTLKLKLTSNHCLAAADEADEQYAMKTMSAMKAEYADKGGKAFCGKYGALHDQLGQKFYQDAQQK